MTEATYIFGSGSGIAKIVSQIDFGQSEVIFISRSSNDLPGYGYEEIVENYSEQTINQLLSKRPNHTKINVIFCNGITDQGIFSSLNSQQIDNITEVNFTIPMKITNCFLRNYTFTETRFIYLGSTRAEKGDRGIVMYSATKSALVSAVKSLSLEFSNFEKYFFVLSIGLTESGLINKISDSKIDYLKKRAAISAFVNEAELQNSIMFLLKNKSMTGSILYCDNGYS